MPVKKYIEGKHTHVKVYTNDLEITAYEQLKTLANMPLIHHHIAAMPDVHCDLGATIGSVIPTKGAIIPAAVGVDIGCGMRAYRLNIHKHNLPNNLTKLRYSIQDSVPHGRSDNGGLHDKGAWDAIPDTVMQWWNENGLWTKMPDIMTRHPGILKGNVNTYRHLGTLGTGNHFIEICIDEVDRVWIVIHSGSRGIGNRLGQYFIQLAKKEMLRYFIDLPDKNLAYLVANTQYFNDYLLAVQWAQDYALQNRKIMMGNTLSTIKKTIQDCCVTQKIECHHNFIALENHFGSNVWVTRKGAVRARKGDMVVIPGSMGAKSYIARGLGNKDSLQSCAHGAGRTMSRTAARKAFTVKDLEEQTMGIECRKDIDVLDEIPSSYKDIDTVMENQNDLVEIVHTLRQVINIKG